MRDTAISVITTPKEELKKTQGITASPAQPDRLLFLDGLRAIAALWVFFGHTRLFALGWDATHTMFGKPLDVLLYMHIGVDIFLVLSGFCLALPVVRNADRIRTSLADFFTARALRILPPYFATLGLILLINFFVPLSSWGRHSFGLTSDISPQIFLANVLLLQDIMPQLNVVNAPFWSVACELHLYFLFPLSIWAMRRFGTFALLLLGANIAILLTWLSFILPDYFPGAPVVVFQPPYFISLFVMGIAAASFAYAPRFSSLRRSIYSQGWMLCGALLIPLLLVLWTNRILNSATVGRFFDHTFQIDPLCGAITAAFLMAMSGLSPTHWARRLLEQRVLVWIGGFSYSFYLVHIPILASIYHWMGLHDMTAPPARSFFTLASLSLASTLVFAWAFSRIVERRIRWRPFSTAKNADNAYRKDEKTI